MPGDPIECREHAKNCLKLAAEATTPEAKESFESLAHHWLKLAVELERAKAHIDQWGPPKEGL